MTLDIIELEGIKIKEKTVKDNLKILLIFILVLAVSALILFVLAATTISAIYKPWIASIIILVIFLIVLWNMRERASWKQYGMIIVCITAFIGCFFNIQGNAIYNLPIEWVYNDIGQLNILNETEKIGSEYITNFTFQIVDSDGAVIKSISSVAIAVFRFFEYLIMSSVVLTIVVPVICRMRKGSPKEVVVTEKKWDNWEERQEKELDKRAQIQRDSRQLSGDVEEVIKTLIREDKTIQAIKVVREHTSLSLAEAKKLVESISSSVQS